MGDGDGLFLVVKAGGAERWVCRVQRHRNRRDFGLGSASKVSLAIRYRKSASARVD